jgi:aspartyl-tRNA(Asn)/glutamyl-tRNA(Gln) amidotransferase subunit A
MDHVGPLCRSVEDAGFLYDALLGQLTPRPVGTVTAKGLRVGVLRNYFTAVLDGDVAQQFEGACSRLREAGVDLEEVAIPHASDIAPIYLHIVLSEAAEYHAKTLDSRPDDYTPGVRLRLEMGRYILAEDYARALRGRRLLMSEVDQALSNCDALFLPTLAIPAFKIGTTSINVGGSEESIRNITLRLTQLFDVTGHPAITIPCGTTPLGLPIGMQLAGRIGGTYDLLQLAHALEMHVRGAAA